MATMEGVMTLSSVTLSPIKAPYLGKYKYQILVRDMHRIVIYVYDKVAGDMSDEESMKSLSSFS
jgi:hypothetical protein